MQTPPFLRVAMVASLFTLSIHAADWQMLFDGKSLDGWKSNDETPGCFTLENGELKVSGGRAHLFYVGKDGQASFKNFEFQAKVKTTPGSNSGIFFHTAYQASGWPSQGYEAQVNSTHSDPRKTGSLYAVSDVMNNAPSKDGEWFDYLIRVEGKHITIKVDGKTVVDFTEPADVQPPEGRPGRQLSQGTFAIQGHDPNSTTYYKDIRVRVLP